MSRVFPIADGRIELTDSEAQIVDLLTNYQDQMVIIRALKVFCNAEKVVEVLLLQGRLKRPHASYTIWPIIVNIGDRTPGQYVEDVNRAVAAFNEMYWKYFNREINLAEWDAYLRRKP